jgi:hypothetical protein
MDNKIKYIIGAAVFMLALVIGGTVAFANPSYFGPGVTTNSAASTTPAYMTPGAATTTTPVYNSYAQNINGGLHFKADKATLGVQFLASSTNSTLNIAVEYSNDGVDWYRDFTLDSNAMGTTTTPYNLSIPHTMSWKFASSSVGGLGVAANNNMSTAYLIIPTPAKYTRVVFSCAIGGTNCGVWAELTPIREML